MKIDSFLEYNTIQTVQLQVSNLQQSLGFYHKVLGFQILSQQDNIAELSASGNLPVQIILLENSDAVPKPYATAGLFHIAIRVPSSIELARIYQHLTSFGWPIHGLSDHGVSLALYTADPDGLGIEVYHDIPRESWLFREGRIDMISDPYPVKKLLENLTDMIPLWKGIHPESRIGHIHLQVSNLETSAHFYRHLLGMDIMQDNYPGALFLSYDQYHHHIALNIWAGKDIPFRDDSSPGIMAFTLSIGSDYLWQQLEDMLHRSMEHSDFKNSNFQVKDPTGITIKLIKASEKA